MNRIDAIKQRLNKYTSADTDTDGKLENGAIMDWVEHSDGDARWLLYRVGDLLDALTEMCAVYGNCDGLTEADKHVHGLARAAIAKAKEKGFE